MIDVIIISDAFNDQLCFFSDQTICTLLRSEEEDLFNIIVYEKQKDIEYDNKSIKTIHYDEFNYNKLLNKGIEQTNNEWILCANNDLIFKEEWLTRLLKYKRFNILSPRCPWNQSKYEGIEEGVLSDWCFLIRRKIWEKINGFNEDYNFWCSDNAIKKQFEEINEKYYLIGKSHVCHLTSSTIKCIDDKELKYDYTHGQLKKFRKKYG